MIEHKGDKLRKLFLDACNLSNEIFIESFNSENNAETIRQNKLIAMYLKNITKLYFPLLREIDNVQPFVFFKNGGD